MAATCAAGTGRERHFEVVAGKVIDARGAQHRFAFARNGQATASAASVQPFLDVRTAVLNGTLEDASYPGFRPANDDHKATAAAA